MAVPLVSKNIPLVAVVDTDPVVQDLVAALLSAEGYRVTKIGQTPATFAEIASRRPALLIIDLGITHPESWLLLAQLRRSAATRSIPQIVVSTVPSELTEARELCPTPDHSRFLAKPLDLNDLRAAVHELFRTTAPESGVDSPGRYGSSWQTTASAVPVSAAQSH